jgi:hypothetical protein
MAVDIKKVVTGTALTTSLVTLYTVQANTRVRVNELLLCNTDTTARTFTVNFVDSGDTAAVKNTVFTVAPIGAKDTLTLGLDQVLEAGDFVQASADAADVVSIRLSGVEVS